MTGVVSLALAADEPAARCVAEALFPDAEHWFLTRDELRRHLPGHYVGQMDRVILN